MEWDAGRPLGPLGPGLDSSQETLPGHTYRPKEGSPSPQVDSCGYNAELPSLREKERKRQVKAGLSLRPGRGQTVFMAPAEGQE